MKTINYLAALTLLVIVFTASALAQEYRNFTGSNGRIIEAAFLGFDEATQIVKLRLKDGREQNVKLDLFAAESQQWIKSGGKEADNPFGDDRVSGYNDAMKIIKAGDRKVLTIKDVEYAFRWCPPGKFRMGSPESEEGRGRNETQHQVTLTSGFLMLETEVTQQMWISVMGNNPSEFNGAKRPVEKVSWNDSQEYITKLNGMNVAPAGFKFSLPTEAQWEYACRAGTTTVFHFGGTLNKEQANFGQGSQMQGVALKDWQGTTEVGSFPANAWGLYDMHGNASELVLCRYDDYPSGAVTDPIRRDSRQVSHVRRGGSYIIDAKFCRSASRHTADPSNRNPGVGLRLALVHIE